MPMTADDFPLIDLRHRRPAPHVIAPPPNNTFPLPAGGRLPRSPLLSSLATTGTPSPTRETPRDAARSD